MKSPSRSRGDNRSVTIDPFSISDRRAARAAVLPLEDVDEQRRQPVAAGGGYRGDERDHGVGEDVAALTIGDPSVQAAPTYAAAAGSSRATSPFVLLRESSRFSSKFHFQIW